MSNSQANQVPDAQDLAHRIYVGNLLYTVRPHEIEDLLASNTSGGYTKIEISIDPISGRNPGYCFVEFTTAEDAHAAIKSLSGFRLRNRPLKTGPCRPEAKKRDRASQYQPKFRRFGEWQGADALPQDQQGPAGAFNHLEQYLSTDRAVRVFVGGLPKMKDQPTHDLELRQIFRDFKVVAIGKRITPSEATRSTPGNHHFCFLDLDDTAEAERAIATLNGQIVTFPTSSRRTKLLVRKSIRPPANLNIDSKDWRGKWAFDNDGKYRDTRESESKNWRAREAPRSIRLSTQSMAFPRDSPGAVEWRGRQTRQVNHV